MLDHDEINYTVSNIFHVFDLCDAQRYLYKGKSSSFIENQIALCGNNIYNSEELNFDTSSFKKMSNQQKSKILYILELAKISKDKKLKAISMNADIAAKITKIANFLKEFNDEKICEKFSSIYKTTQNNDLPYLYLPELLKTMDLRWNNE